MLALTRKLDEKIQIGDDITITVVAIHNNAVQLGIETPKEVNIKREEITKDDDKEPADDKTVRRLSFQLLDSEGRSLRQIVEKHPGGKFFIRPKAK